MRLNPTTFVGALLGALLATSRAGAQDPPPPMPAEPTTAPGEPAEAARTTAAPAASGGGNLSASAQLGMSASEDPFAEAAGGSEARADASGDATAGAGATSSEGSTTKLSASSERRRIDLRNQNSLYGSTGLLHTVAAGSGPEGSLRISLIGSLYSGSDFLCQGNDSCADVRGKKLLGSDSVDLLSTRLGISATVTNFLEAYAMLRSQSVANDHGEPKVIQVVGEPTIGLKAFMPREADRIFAFGGGLQLGMMSAPGAVGVDATRIGLQGHAMLDLTERSNPDERIPVRALLNFGYTFDNSGSVADTIESARTKALGKQQRITRVERFGNDINRVDVMPIALGVEGAFDAVRPFMEWSIDVPVNRQGYKCSDALLHPDDKCLADLGVGDMPSRLTLGARAYPWEAEWLEGLALLAAVDIGTGGRNPWFAEEMAPQVPWMLHLGLAYAVDTQPRVIERAVPVAPKVVAAPPEREYYIEGVVVKAGGEEPVEGAVLRYQGIDKTGLVTDAAGRFKSQRLTPGPYTFQVAAYGYKDGSCQAVVEPIVERAEAAGAAPGAATKPEEPSGHVRVTPLRCELEALPRTATIDGVLRDAQTTEPIPSAQLTITDPKGRSLSLQTDETGGFRFQNVIEGTSTIVAAVDGYLPSAVKVELQARKDVTVQLMAHKKPAKANVQVTANELKLREQVHFLHGSAEILTDSMALLEEIAAVLKQHAEIAGVEIQGHTDDTGTEAFNQTLSDQRAQAVRDSLVRLGVEPGRLTAKGYGQSQPKVPNTSAANRAKNRRVQLMIQH